MFKIKSRFIETPCKRTVRIKDDLTTKDGPSGISEISVYGLHVRYDVSIFQDEIGEVDKAMLTKELTERGALSVDIRINAVPRETIRAAAVLEAETLRGEIEAMAELRGETIDPEILVMADLLENTPGEEILKGVGG